MKAIFWVTELKYEMFHRYDTISLYVPKHRSISYYDIVS